MSVPSVLRGLILPAAMAFAQSATAGVEAGFDCAKAATPTERAICNDPETAAADYAMGRAFTALLDNTTDPHLREALRADQRSFIALRSKAFEGEVKPAIATERLRDSTELRAERLNWIDTNPSEGLLGHWVNLWGMVRITKTPDGFLKAEAEAVDQLSARWRCGFDGLLMEKGPDEAMGHTLGADLPIRRRGALLEIPEPFCDETGPALQGSLQGLYFKVGGDD